MHIRIKERGDAIISGEVWKRLSNSRDFWALVEQNILRVNAAPRNQWRLSGTCYVGRATIDSIVVEVVEKFDGALAVLVDKGICKGPKLAPVPSPISADMKHVGLMIEMFIRSAKTYLSGHKLRLYVKAPGKGALLGGRLNIRKTIELRAKGRLHQAAFERTVFSADMPLNRFVYAALREVERIAAIVELDPLLITSARGLQLGLSECAASIIGVRRAVLAKDAASYARSIANQGSVASDVASFASAILNAAGFGDVLESDAAVATSWFLNLETLFEDAVRNVARSVIDGRAKVSRPTVRPPLFVPDPGRYRANPDVVIKSNDETRVVIGDVKYKNLEQGWPNASDIHELLSHSSAYGADSAILFYPAVAGGSVTPLGTAATGCRVWIVAIPFSDFESTLLEAFDAMGLA